jgi:hypothetical protein
MPRTTIAAVLAMLLFLAPAASARPADVGYPAYPTPEVPAESQVMSERTTDHPAPTANDIKNALAQEQTYSTKGNPAVGGLVLEQESTSGSGNQGTAPAPAPAPATDDETPWVLIGVGFAGVALVLGSAVLLVTRPRRTRIAV